MLCTNYEDTSSTNSQAGVVAVVVSEDAYNNNVTHVICIIIIIKYYNVRYIIHYTYIGSVCYRDARAHTWSHNRRRLCTNKLLVFHVYPIYSIYNNNNIPIIIIILL